MTNWTLDNINELNEKHQIQYYHHATQYSLTSIIIISIIVFILFKNKSWLIRKFQRNAQTNLRGEELEKPHLTIGFSHTQANDAITTPSATATKDRLYPSVLYPSETNVITI